MLPWRTLVPNHGMHTDNHQTPASPTDMTRGAMTREDEAGIGPTEEDPSSEAGDAPRGKGKDTAKASKDRHANSPDTPSGSVSDRAGEDEPDVDAEKPATTSRRISVSLRLRTLVVASLLVLLLAATGAMTWLYLGERGKVEAQQRQAAADRHAEQIALDYAVGAAKVNFQDLNAWKARLIQGTTPNLARKLTKAGTQMQQLFIPLEWNSDATPLVAKVRSNTNGIYVVDTFVSVTTKTKQTPDVLPSTATYSITIDSNDNWQISDVGGIGALAGPK